MNVTTWDFAQSGLDKTNKLALERGVSVQTELVDLNEAKWPTDSWDEIICVFGHFPTELRTKTLQQIKKAVKPGGYFITEVYSHYQIDRKSTRLNSSHVSISYAVFCLKKKYVFYKFI